MSMIFPLLAATLALVIQNPDMPPATQPASIASAALFASDTRLTQKVTFAVPSITLNAALKQITAQTGVSVKMRDSKIIGEQKICVFADGVEAKQLLESVAALLRYKNISSEWQKDATGEGYALSIGGQYYAAAARKAGAPIDPKMLLSNITINGKPLDLDSINPENVVVNRSEDGKSVSVMVASSSNGPTPISGDIQVFRTTTVSPGGTATATPSSGVAVSNEQKPGTGARTNTVKARKPVVDDWFTRYDLRKNTIENAPLPSVDGTAPTPNNTVTGLLSAIARQEKIPVIAMLPDAALSGDGAVPIGASASGSTLANILAGLNGSGYRFSYKWHQGTLLLRDPLAPFQ